MNDDIERIEPMSNGNIDEEGDEIDCIDENEQFIKEQIIQNNEYHVQNTKEENKPTNYDEIPFIDNEKNL